MSAARNSASTGNRDRGRSSCDDDIRNVFLKETLNWINEYERTTEVSEETEPDWAARVEGPIQVKFVHFYVSENATAHHTDMYEIVHYKKPMPVLRRGQSFFVLIRFNRKYDPGRDIVKLEFYAGYKPALFNKTLVRLLVAKCSEFSEQKQKQWEVCLVKSQHGDDLLLEVHIPSNVYIGIWKLRVITEDRTQKGAQKTYDCEKNVFILFNPWNKDDGVYMADEKWIEEYVLNDIGKIFDGTCSTPTSRTWFYGQFNSIVLPTCMYLLELSRLDYVARADPVKVVRAISAVVNCQDENGVLVGKWSGTYEDLTAPWVWTGSTAILKQYIKNQGEPVRYGQCWVFGGVTTTVCRALGIPCRPITNYGSAHDKNEDMVANLRFEKNGLHIASSDSVWNYHVWNDVWMCRPDLPSGHGGWQALDATPQKTSEGIFRVGPASLVAVRNGERWCVYDTAYVFSEINAKVVYWIQEEHGDRKIYSSKRDIGKLICTKAVGRFDQGGIGDMENIVDQYKNLLGGSTCGAENEEQADVKIVIEEQDVVAIGKPIRFCVKLQNTSDEVRSGSIALGVVSVYYTGVVAGAITNRCGKFELERNATCCFTTEVKPEEYLTKLVDYSMIRIFATEWVCETQQMWTTENDLELQKPILKLEIYGGMTVGKEFMLRASFANPLNTLLTCCSLNLECPGVSTLSRIDVCDVPPCGDFSFELKLTPQKDGERTLFIVFDSRELNAIKGCIKFKVNPC